MIPFYEREYSYVELHTMLSAMSDNKQALMDSIYETFHINVKFIDKMIKDCYVFHEDSSVCILDGRIVSWDISSEPSIPSHIATIGETFEGSVSLHYSNKMNLYAFEKDDIEISFKDSYSLKFTELYVYLDMFNYSENMTYQTSTFLNYDNELIVDRGVIDGEFIYHSHRYPAFQSANRKHYYFHGQNITDQIENNRWRYPLSEKSLFELTLRYQ